MISLSLPFSNVASFLLLYSRARCCIHILNIGVPVLSARYSGLSLCFDQWVEKYFRVNKAAYSRSPRAETKDKDDPDVANLTIEQKGVLIGISVLYAIIALISLFGYAFLQLSGRNTPLTMYPSSS